MPLRAHEPLWTLRWDLIHQDPNRRFGFDHNDVPVPLDGSSLQILDHERRYGVQLYWCEAMSVSDENTAVSKFAPDRG